MRGSRTRPPTPRRTMIGTRDLRAGSTPSTTPNAWYRSLVRRAGRFRDGRDGRRDSNQPPSKPGMISLSNQVVPERRRQPSRLDRARRARRERRALAGPRRDRFDATRRGRRARPRQLLHARADLRAELGEHKGAKCSTYARPLGRYRGRRDFGAAVRPSLRSAARSACAADQRNATATRSSHSGTTQGGSGSVAAAAAQERRVGVAKPWPE